MFGGLECSFNLKRNWIMPGSDQFSEFQRDQIWNNAGGRCQVKITCTGKQLNRDDWQADHIIPVSKNGKTDVSNGQASCPECNQAKGNRL